MGIFARKRLQSLAVAFVFAFTSVTTVLTQSVSAVAGDINPWQTATNSLPEGVAFPGGVEMNGYLYVIGGHLVDDEDFTTTTEVHYSQLSNDGQPGAWSPTTNLPSGLNYSSTTTANGYIYVSGSTYEQDHNTKIFYAKQNSDGTLGQWQTVSMPNNRLLASIIAVNDYIYLLGGSVYEDETYNPTPPVLYAHLNSDGSTGEWTVTTVHFPIITALPNVVTHNNYIYAIGGGQDNYDGFTPAHKTVYYTQVNNDGSIGPWITTSPLDEPTVFSSSIVMNGYIYTMGGMPVVGGVEAVARDTVAFSQINSDGTLSEWQSSEQSLPLPKGAAAVAKTNDTIYVLAGLGFVGDDAINGTTVYFTSFSPQSVDTPANITAVSPTTQKPAISWNSAAGATSYTVYRNGSIVGTSATTSFTDSALNTDGNYTYTVTASNGSITSEQSSHVVVQYDATNPTATNGKISGWLSLIGAKPTITANVSDNLSGVIGGEYFTDVDPGQGNGTPMTYDSSTGKIKAVVPIVGQSSGLHTIYMRSKDAAGNWSTTTYAQYYQL